MKSRKPLLLKVLVLALLVALLVLPGVTREGQPDADAYANTPTTVAR
jgi:hypothetical protein